MERRSFLAATLAAAAPLARGANNAERRTGSSGGELIDTNVYLPAWPIRRAWADTPAQLVEKLRRHGVTSAWTGSFEGVLHTDVAGVNARLAEVCAREGGGMLRAFGTVNPTLPDWEEDVRRCHEVHGMRGLRLFPSYHGYGLDDARFARLIELAARRTLIVQIVLLIEDERSQNPVLTAAPVQVPPLLEVLKKIPKARVMLLNAGARVLTGAAPLLQPLTAAGVCFEIATLEGVAGIEAVWQRTPGARLMFGSHAPYFYFEAALLKLQESALTAEQLAAIRSGNARAAIA